MNVFIALRKTKTFYSHQIVCIGNGTCQKFGLRKRKTFWGYASHGLVLADCSRFNGSGICQKSPDFFRTRSAPFSHLAFSFQQFVIPASGWVLEFCEIWSQWESTSAKKILRRSNNERSVGHQDMYTVRAPL